MSDDVPTMIRIDLEDGTPARYWGFPRPGFGVTPVRRGALDPFFCLHRDDGPAVETDDGFKAWWEHDHLIRFEGPR